MIKEFFKKLFKFPTKNVVGKNNYLPENKLTSGQNISFKTPIIENHKEFTLTKWYFNSGDIVKTGDVICEIENKKFSMELESFYTGKITLIKREKEILKPNEEICRISGI
ncbi:hypothetical protein N9V96_02880 [Polaribacter sp.]|nr:hypothetical protein [Polaribacter sp.]